MFARFNELIYIFSIIIFSGCLSFSKILRIPPDLNGIWTVQEKSIGLDGDILVIDSEKKPDSEKPLSNFYLVRQSGIKKNYEIFGLHFLENKEGQIILVLRVADNTGMARQYFALIESDNNLMTFVATHYRKNDNQILISDKKDIVMTLVKKSGL
jgi:hypothetical protein